MRGMDHESGQARSSLLLSFEKFTKFMLLQSKGQEPERYGQTSKHGC